MSSDWFTVACREIAVRADAGDDFTPDDILDSVGHPDEGHAANGANNTVGRAFGEMHRRGVIVPVGVAKSRQPARKGGMVRVWRGVNDGRLRLEDAS